MKKRTHNLISVLTAAVLFIGSYITAYSATLEDGSVKGLPERLVVLDDDGNSVSDKGEYFFEVEGMKANEVYTKNIQIMNLREDASYDIWFSALPIGSKGEIDIENECVCSIYLDGEKVYSGKVTGEGSPDIREKPLNLGTYAPGDSHAMKVDIVWKPAEYGSEIDNGARLYDYKGKTVLREGSGIKEISGETVFKWIVSAAVKTTSATGDEPQTSSDPILGFFQTGETITFIVIGVMVISITVMVILIVSKRRKQ